MGSTASVAMKLFFGAKPGKFCLRSTIWIDANHRRECGVSVLPADKHSQASGAKSVEGSIASRPSLQRSKDHVSAHTLGCFGSIRGFGGSTPKSGLQAGAIKRACDRGLIH